MRLEYEVYWKSEYENPLNGDVVRYTQRFQDISLARECMISHKSRDPYMKVIEIRE